MNEENKEIGNFYWVESSKSFMSINTVSETCFFTIFHDLSREWNQSWKASCVQMRKLTMRNKTQKFNLWYEVHKHIKVYRPESIFNIRVVDQNLKLGVQVSFVSFQDFQKVHKKYVQWKRLHGFQNCLALKKISHLFFTNVLKFYHFKLSLLTHAYESKNAERERQLCRTSALT